MQTRASYQKAAPEVYQSLLALHATVQKSDLPTGLVNLVYYRVSQINGCAFCLDMLSMDRRALGETALRLKLIRAGRVATHLFVAGARAALAWAEAVTRLVELEVPDAIYEEARGQFSETELAQLTLAVVAINGWNRLNIAFRTPAGNYKAPAKRSAA
jgi:AhpD family alkylhydroperoxidase